MDKLDLIYEQSGQLDSYNSLSKYNWINVCRLTELSEKCGQELREVQPFKKEKNKQNTHDRNSLSVENEHEARYKVNESPVNKLKRLNNRTHLKQKIQRK